MKQPVRLNMGKPQPILHVRRMPDGQHFCVEIISASGFVLAESVPVDLKSTAITQRADIREACRDPLYVTDP